MKAILYSPVQFTTNVDDTVAGTEDISKRRKEMITCILLCHRHTLIKTTDRQFMEVYEYYKINDTVLLTKCMRDV